MKYVEGNIMVIRDMFKDDINRPINGVVKVDEDTEKVLAQELDEYVITRELKKHFISFFNYYDDAFDTPTSDIGVWISGFFGSGKSHFLKMLSYLLENRTVEGVKTAERFRGKFEDDAATFMLVDKATKAPTETILFNIDIEGPINKDDTAVIRVFAKMFYNHLGFYGENLKVAKLEQYVHRCGKTEEFHRVFEEKNGSSWVESRDAFAFFEDDVVETLQEVLAMSETAAHHWFDGTETVEISIAQLVLEMKEYVEKKPKNFRMLFMIDEVGQYIGSNVSMLTNLQSLVEKIGSECNGKIWVCCTGQEALDDIIKVRQNEFSRIQARFKSRLSLTSSSVDEVIQRRLLKKKPEAETKLVTVYEENDSILRNIFTFKTQDARADLKGYQNVTEFVSNFPFVPYQFILIQQIFAEIRKHGNAGKHYSGAERSMLDGFQISAKKIQEKDQYALATLSSFYDSIHTFLDGAIRRVIDRCERAANEGLGVEVFDVEILKLLYLIKYIDDVKSNVDNIVILMADDIRVNKGVLKEAVKESLARLLSQNYIARVGDTYNFLTDEEQDIQRDINETVVDTSGIVERIAHTIFGDIYQTKKFRYNSKYDFSYDQMVDNITIGALTNGMKLRFLTVASDLERSQELKLMTDSKNAVIVVLDDTDYFESIEKAMKIRKYVKTRNINQLSTSIQNIIKQQQEEASKYEFEAIEQLSNAIISAKFYIDGEKIELRSGSVSVKEEDPIKKEVEIKKAKARNIIDQGLEYLVSNVYRDLELITKNYESDADIAAILKGSFKDGVIAGYEPNAEAASKVEEFLEMQSVQNRPTSMSDIQSRYQSIPYGWKEIDIASVVAMLVYDQKVTIKYAGSTIQPNNPKLPDLLRKKSEIGKTGISKRQVISLSKMKSAKELLREFLDVMDVPDDEDGMVLFIVDRFTKLKNHYDELLNKYNKNKYPDRVLVIKSSKLLEDILSQQKDNIALIERVLSKENELFDNKEDIQRVESFFKNQVVVFDAATKLIEDMRNDLDYLSKEETANEALNQIRLITMIPTNGTYNYRRIPELNELMNKVHEGHDKLLDGKREELLEIVRQCLEAIHTASQHGVNVKTIITTADSFYTQKKERIAELKSIALLDALLPQMLTYKDETLDKIENMQKPVAPQIVKPQGTSHPIKNEPNKIYKTLNRQIVFPAKTLESESDIDIYVEKMREQLKQLIKNCDGIKLS